MNTETSESKSTRSGEFRQESTGALDRTGGRKALKFREKYEDECRIGLWSIVVKDKAKGIWRREDQLVYEGIIQQDRR